MKYLVACVVVLFLTVPVHSYAQTAAPIATDSRVRTLVYGENEVFKIISKFGYQSNIEFGPEEEIETISLGDAVSWNVTPAGNRLFVKALREDSQTNLTVVTSLRAYQFDLSSVVNREEDVIYVVRFFYPETDFDARKRRPEDNTFESGAFIEASYNFNYSLTGPKHIAPIQVFDDGRFTFFKFPNNNAGPLPTFYMVDNQGNEVPLVGRSDGEFVVVERVFKQYALRQGGDIVCVFNDSATSPLPVAPAGNTPK